MTLLRNDENAMIKRMRQYNEKKKALIFGVTLTIGEYVIVSPLAQYLKNIPRRTSISNMATPPCFWSTFAAVKSILRLLRAISNRTTMTRCTTGRKIYPCLCGWSPLHKRCKNAERPAAGKTPSQGTGLGNERHPGKNLETRNLSISDFSHIVEVENMHTIVSLLVQDCGVAFLYQAAVRQEIESGLLRQIPLADFEMEHDFTFLWNKGSVFSEYYADICGELKTCE